MNTTMTTEGESLFELDVEEQLFAGVVHLSIEDCDELLSRVVDINVKNGSGRTLLHLAVKVGRLDWVERLLLLGSDPCSRDLLGSSVMDVATEMVRKYPGDTNRELIRRFVRLAVERGKVVDESSGEGAVGGEGSVVSQGDLEEALRASRVLGEYVKRSVEQMNEKFASQTENFSQKFSSLAVDISCITDQFQNLTSLGEGFEAMRSDLTSLTIQLTPYLVSSNGEVMTLREKIGAISDDTLSIRERMNELKSDIALLSNKLTLSGDSSVGMTSEIPSVNSDQSVCVTHLSFLKKAVVDLDKKLTCRDILLEALETSVTSLVENLRPTIESREPLALKDECVGPETTDSASSIPQRVLSNAEETNCAKCIRGMLKKTTIYNENDGTLSIIKRLYHNIYSASPLTSSILNYLQNQPCVTIAVDGSSSKIDGMKGMYTDHNGFQRSTSYLSSFADFEEKRVYVGALPNNFQPPDKDGLITRSLLQLSLYLAFQNGGRPLPEGDEVLEEKLKLIFKELEERRRNGVYLDWFIFDALAALYQPNKEMLLIAAVPAIIVSKGMQDGVKLLRTELPLILDYYVDHILIALHGAEQNQICEESDLVFKSFQFRKLEV